MLKFFRTYIANKYVIITGMVLLMIVFLLPFGGRILQPDPTAQPIGRFDDQELTVSDRRNAAAEIELLGSIQGRLAYMLRQQPQQLFQLLQNAPDLELFMRAQVPREPLRWLLILEEARRNGIYVSRARARSMMQQLPQANVDVTSLIRQSRVSESFFLRALQHWAMYVQLRNMVDGAMVSGGQRPSAPRMRHFAQDFMSRASVKLVQVDPDHLMDEVEPPSEEKVRETFEKYKANRPGESEPYGFGYRIPPRVKLEYLTIPLARVADSIEVTGSEVARYYLEQPERFLPNEPESESSEPDAGDEQAESSGQNANGGNDGNNDGGDQAADSGKETSGSEASDGKPKPWGALSTEVREKVRAALIDERAREKQQKVIRWLTATLNEHRRGLEKDQQGYYKLGSDYEPPSFEQIAERMQQRFGVLPDVVRIGDEWKTLDEVAALEGLGAASLEQSNQQVSVRQYISSIPKLELDVPQPVQSLRLQVGVASDPVADEAGNRYLFRITAAEPSHAPESLAEVRDRVVRDLKRLQAYRMLTEKKEELRQRAVEQGLETLTEKPEGGSSGGETSEPEAEVQETGMFSRLNPPQLTGIGRSEPFARAVFDLAAKVQSEGGLGQVEPAKTFTAIPIDSAQRVVVAQLTDYQPVNSQRYERLKPRLVQMMNRQQRQGGAPRQTSEDQDSDPLSQDALAKRLNFQPSEPSEAERAQQGEGDGAAPTSTLH